MFDGTVPLESIPFRTLSDEVLTKLLDLMNEQVMKYPQVKNQENVTRPMRQMEEELKSRGIIYKFITN